jgi:D-3-phosphoglycerate dehydrogenase
MTETVENLIVDLVEWVGSRDHSYRDTLEAWRTSCPRLPVWEEANDRGLLETVVHGGISVVRPTPAGLRLLRERRPRVWAVLVKENADVMIRSADHER